MVEEEEAKTVKSKQFLDDLSRVSVKDLEIYIEELKTEIQRVKLEISRKGEILSNAKSLFK